jgi:outer membrane lipoprotein LolB
VRALGALLAAAFLAGCAAVPEKKIPVPPPGEIQRLFDARRVALESIDSWELSGKLGIKARRGGSAHVSWSRKQDLQTIRLRDPLGRGLMMLTEDPGGAVLTDRKKETYRGTTARKVLYRTTGWDIPFELLGWWIRGLPAPAVAAKQQRLDHAGRLEHLQQGGWDVDFEEYRQVGSIELPRTLRLRADARAVGPEGEPNETVEVRVIVKRWEGLAL